MGEICYKPDESDDFPQIEKHKTKCFYDCELYDNEFFIVCKVEGNYWVYRNPAKCKTFKKLWEDAIMIGFNNKEYDSRMVNAFFEFSKKKKFDYKANKADFIQKMKETNNDIILSQKRNSNEFGNAGRQKNNHYDTKIGCGKKDRSLKEWELLLGMSVKESPIPFTGKLTPENVKSAVEYCCHDVDATEALFDKACLDNFEAIGILCELAKQPANYGKTIGSITVDLLCFLSGVDKKDLKAKSKFYYDEIKRRLKKSRYLDMDNVAEVLDSIEEYEMEGMPEIKEAYLGHINVGDMQIEIGAGGAHWCSRRKKWEKCDDSDVASMYPNIMLAYQIIDRTLGLKGNEAFAEMIQTRLKNKKTDPKLAGALKNAINAVYGKLSGDGGLNDPSGRLGVCVIGQLVICDLVARYVKHIKDCQFVQVNTDGVIYTYDKTLYKDIAEKQMKEWSEMFSMDLETVPIEFIYQHNINNYVAETISGDKTEYKYKGAFFKSSNGTKSYIYKSLTHFALRGEKPDIREFPKTDFIDLVKSRKVGGTNEKYDVLVNGEYVPNKLIPYVKTANGVPISFRNPIDGKITGLTEKIKDVEDSELGLESSSDETTIKTLPTSCQVIYKRDDALEVEPDYDELEKDVDAAIASLKSEMKEKQKIHWKEAVQKEENKEFLKRHAKAIKNGELPKSFNSPIEFLKELEKLKVGKANRDKWHNLYLSKNTMLDDESDDLF